MAKRRTMAVTDRKFKDGDPLPVRISRQGVETYNDYLDFLADLKSVADENQKEVTYLKTYWKGSLLNCFVSMEDRAA